MKKIISVLLAAGMAMSLLPVGYADFRDVEKSEAIDVVCGIGLMEGYADGTFLPDNNLTRAEFAQIAAGIYRYGEEDDAVSEWKQNFFEGVFDETELIPPEVMNEENSELFWDVGSQNEAYDAIKLVYEKGIMVGLGDGSFAPEGNVTVEQVLKVIMSMMGYGKQAAIYGGYPNGYTAVASEVGITDGINDFTKYATREDIAKILYNALDVPLMQLRIKGTEMTYEAYEDDTFLTKFLNMDYDFGRMTNDGYNTFSGKSEYASDWIVINNIRYKINEETEYVRDYMGRDVKVYYSLDEDNDALVYVSLTNKDEVVSFDISEFEGYENTKIMYLPKNASREKHINLKNAVYMIKNGAAVESFDNSIFDYNYGTVEIITPTGATAADLIILKSYSNFNIDYVDTDKEIIYSSTSLLGTEIDLTNDEKRVNIYDSQGNLTNISALAAGMITSVCMSEECVEIRISDSAVSGFTVLGAREDEYGNYQLQGKDKTYMLSKDYIQKGVGAMPRIGSTYNMKLDMFGNAVNLEEVASEYTIGFMNSAKLIDNEESGLQELRVRYYDFASQKLENLYVSDKIKIIATDGTKKNYSLEKTSGALETLLNDYISKTENNTLVRCGNIFRFKTDSDGEPIEFELAGTQENSTDNTQRLVEIKISSSAAKANMYNGNNLIGGKIILTSDTKILKCNYNSDNFNTDSGYSVANKSIFKEGHEYNIRAYSTIKNSPVAEYLVYTADPSTSISTETPQTCAVVTGLYSGLNSDDEAAYFITLDNIEYEVEEGVLDEGNVPNMQGATAYKDSAGKSHNFKIEKGDIIRYGFGADGAINQVQLVYDANSDYSDGLSIGGVVYGGFSKRGNLAGCIDGYNSAVYQFSNPFSANSEDGGNSFAQDPYTWSYYNGHMRVMMGTVVRTGNGYIVTSTRNLQENPGKVSDDGDGVYATNTWSLTSYKLVTIGNKDVKITTEPISNLRSYASLGASCDRIFITTRLGSVFNAVVYRYAD